MDSSEETIKKVARECGIVLPISSEYWYDLHTCYKCDRQMVVFDWGNSEPWRKEDPPKPIPKTVQYRYSNIISDSYWANVCPFCNSVQGDWHLKMEGSFFPENDYDDFYESPEKQVVAEIEEKEPEQKSLL